MESFRYRKTVTAMQWDGINAEALNTLVGNDRWSYNRDTDDVLLTNFSGARSFARVGDWIVLDDDGEFRVYPPQQFARLFERVKD